MIWPTKSVVEGTKQVIGGRAGERAAIRVKCWYEVNKLDAKAEGASWKVRKLHSSSSRYHSWLAIACMIYLYYDSPRIVWQSKQYDRVCTIHLGEISDIGDPAGFAFLY